MALLLGQICTCQGRFKEAETHLLAARDYFSKQSDFIRCKY